MEEKKKKESHDEIIERLDQIIELLKKLTGGDIQTQDEGPDKPPPNPPGGGG